MATSVITGTIQDPTGTALANVKVNAVLRPRPAFVTATGVELAATVSTTTNASGVYTFTLTRTADITPADSYYEITEYIPDIYGGVTKHVIQVGAVGATVYASLTNTVAPSAASYLTQSAADARYVQSPGSFAVSPAASRPADTADAGVLTTYTRGDHKHSRETIYGTAAARAALSSPDPVNGQTFIESDTLKWYHRIAAAWKQVTQPWVDTEANKPATNYAGQSIYVTDATNIVATGVYTPDTTSQPARIGNIWHHNGTRWQYGEWGKPWGIVGYAQSVAGQSGVTTVTDVTGATITFVAAANRRYKITGQFLAASTVVGDTIRLEIADGSNVTQFLSQLYASITGQSNVLPITNVVSPAAGSITYKLRFSRAAGTGTISYAAGATFPAFILIEDIGPNGAPA